MKIMTCITCFFVTLLILVYTQGISVNFEQDLAYVCTTIMENHPGVYNYLDSDFVSRMNRESTIAHKKLLTAASEEEKIKIMEAFGTSFHDPHLWIRYRTKPLIYRKGAFTYTKISDTVHWVSIPSFQPDGNQQQKLSAIITTLSHLRTCDIVFDVRGNGGGNSIWAEEITKALFGTGYVEQQLAAVEEKTVVDWRASRGNIEYLENLADSMREQFGKTHEAVLWIDRVCMALRETFSQGLLYYTELPIIRTQTGSTTSLFHGRLVVLIDKKCASACLDFLDMIRLLCPHAVFIGETTSADTDYMELREVELPSKRGKIGFPVKMYRNRARSGGTPHVPDIWCNNWQDTRALQELIFQQF